jgi:hypothetical protein
MYVNSVYNQMLQSTEERKNMGYDYAKNGLLSRFFSPRMYMNPRVEKFLNDLEPAMIEITESVKKIQFYTNYTIDKNDRRLSI